MESIKDKAQEAASLVDGLPSDLRSVAFQEIFRALLRKEESATVRGAQPARQVEVTGSDQIPSAAVVAAKGSRLHKLLFAAHQLRQSGDASSAAAIRAYLAERLATKIPGTGAFDVLKENTPRYFERRKDGRGFVYEPTPDGLALLYALGGGPEAD
jgi:hypothetical protein